MGRTPLAVMLAWTACDPTPRSEPSTLASALPDAPACDPARAWADDDVAAADALGEAIAATRSRGGRCGELAQFPPAPALAIDPVLTCAARLRALALADPEAFGHADADDRPPWDLLDALGYSPAVASELIATGEVAPTDLVEGIWRASPVHCAALLPGRWRDVGIARRSLPVTDERPEPSASWVVLLGEAVR